MKAYVKDGTARAFLKEGNPFGGEGNGAHIGTQDRKEILYVLTARGAEVSAKLGYL